MYKLLRQTLFNKTTFIIGLLFLLLLWLTQSVNNSELSSNPQNKDPAQIDYYIKNFTNKAFLADGSLQYTLSGTQLEHYKNSDTVTIQKPVLVYTNQHNWTLSSTTAVTTEGLNEEIIFEDNAILRQNGAEAITIKADNFAFSPKNKQFIANSTKKTVSINWKNGNITGNKIIANLIEDTFTLENVKATYHVQ